MVEPSSFEYYGNKVYNLEDFKEVPPILELKEHEKFHDDDNNLFEVEVRGVREEEKIYFKASDIEKLFEMNNLLTDLTQNNNNNFNIDIDYEIFLLTQDRQIDDCGVEKEEEKGKKKYTSGTEEKGKESKKPIETIFFTYNGLLKVIHNSSCEIAYCFRKWATKVIYTAHLDTEEQALDIPEVNAKLVKQVFDTCVTEIPCVYLFHIGTVKRMVEHYPELKEYRSGMLYKFGMTKSLHRRLKEHINDYGALHESDLKLTHWSPINEKYISKAETNLSHYFKDKKVSFQGRNEVIILTRTDMLDVKKKYIEVYHTFGIVTAMDKIMTENDNLVENQKHQEMLLKVKDEQIREINGYREREQEWRNIEKEWRNKEKEWRNKEKEWSNKEKEWMQFQKLILEKTLLNKGKFN